MASEQGIVIPTGDGTCLCCVENAKAFEMIQIFDLVTAVFIVTIPRALGAYKQRTSGVPGHYSMYGKLRIANWMLIMILSLIALGVYLRGIAEDASTDISFETNESKVLEIVGVCAATIVFLIIDFHFCQVVAFSMNQIKFAHEK